MDMTTGPVMAYNFEISTTQGRFRASKVREIGESVELEEVREGGLNGYVHSLVKPASGGKKLIFERGFCEQADSLRMAALLGVRQSGAVTICIYDRQHRDILKTYSAEGWMITKWQLSELDAREGGILLETVEMSYETLKGGDS